MMAIDAGTGAVITGTMKPEDDPSNPSSDYLAMADDWEMICDIREGFRAVKKKAVKYLPKYEKESQAAYVKRLESTPWRPEFVDALGGTCSKPFTKPVTLQGEVPGPIKDLAEDIDGEGNDLHSFARMSFTNGIAMGLEAIYVTYPDVDENLTKAEEKQAGARPYWVHISAKDILACYTRKIGGRDVIDYIRFRETHVARNKFAETIRERVRVIELGDTGKPIWTVYEKQKDPNLVAVEKWNIIETGALTIDVIPIVLYFTGERSGTYRVKTPMGDLAHMQMEIYRALSREEEIMTYAGSPMLKAKGMAAPDPTPDDSANYPHHGVRRSGPQPSQQIEVGPKTVLFAPPDSDGAQSDWDFIQPDAANLKQIADSVDNKIKHFRRLALQPQMPESGRLTATSSALDASRSHSAIECWAIMLKDALEQAFVFTAQWLKITATVEVSVHTDFQVDIEGFDEFTNITNLRTAGDISRKTLWQEAQRRGILGPQFDPDKEEAAVKQEAQDEAAADLDMADKKAAIALKHTPSIPGAGVTA